MPEGDTVFRAARRLHAALAGKVLTRSDFRVPAFATLDLVGRTVDEVVPRGKHLLHRIGDLTVHSHLKMEGRWDVYAPGDRWRRPAHQARVVLDATGGGPGSAADVSTVGFALGVLEVVPRDQESEIVGYLGPDLLGPDWDADLALANLTRDPDRPVGLALLDQRVLAGLGNVYRNELCFLRGVLPTRPVREVHHPARMIALASRLILANRDRSARVTTGVDRPGRRFWVYGRAGKPCLRCGTPIRYGELGESELTLRDTYWCPRCQT
ncbi:MULTISPECIES: DNA-formamidopyrimidine glycosylase family protein [unclassified Curtobacterium]|uniref:DNA-formamidopyrimidine glycosylase family protein n=1 Tax=unclassified Curtobacterium TaxID=257496 RepID=UPI0021BE0E46|nr:DNA-formamidopyrimidine glycosylase family protein [Curtobacterium sp. C2H10]MCT9621754.1 Fpg/Nei family DNA glycosylase [Curtobacterium sp. C2H10]